MSRQRARRPFASRAWVNKSFMSSPNVWSLFQCTVILFEDIETQIGHGQRSAALLMLIVMLVHYPRSIPFPDCAPTHSAPPTGHPDQVERPLRIRLADSVSRHRDLSTRHLQTADFGHY